MGVRHFVRRLLGRGQASVSAVSSDEPARLLLGEVLSREVRRMAPQTSLQQAEFQVFSQFGEDGILQFLIQHTGITAAERRFVEFGVQDYTESNTRFLLLKDYWRGLVIDGSQTHIDRIRAQDYFWRRGLQAVCAWITRENINELISAAGIQGDIGLLSIDIDGNDYWVWERLTVVRPVIVVVEWNAHFGPDVSVTLPYRADFSRAEAHWSHLYWGASISAFEGLARRKGYALVGSNQAGNNLFFVRQDRLGQIPVLTPQMAFVDAAFRDSRDEAGRLSFLGAEAAHDILRSLEVVDLDRRSSCSLQEALASRSMGGGSPEGSQA